MPTIDLRTGLDMAAMLMTPVFAAGGAWVSIKLLREEVRSLKRDVRRLETRVVTLYARLRVPLPIEESPT